MTRAHVRALLLSAMLGASAATAHAEPITLRMAAIAPEGTEWARAIRAFGRDVEAASKGELRMKWYLGGIAGDELAAIERIKQGQLDGSAGAVFCQRLAPTLRGARLAGMYETREELIYVLGRLKPVLDEEFRKAGFANLGMSLFGADVLFSRQPIRTMAELKAARMWAWSLDPTWQTMANEMGLKAIVSSIEEHSAAWRRKQIDSFFAVPSAALAYQWSTEALYFAELPATTLPACLVVSNAAIDPLPIALRQVLTTSAAKFMNRFNEVGARLDGELQNGLFEKQGLTKIPVSPEFRAEFNAEARKARQKLGPALLSPALLTSIEKMLAEYRAHPQEAAPR